MSSTVGPAVGQGVGYGIVLGVGIAFALFMVRSPITSSDSVQQGAMDLMQ